jgi:hypothetical protein
MCVVREKNKSKDHNKHPIEKKYRDFNRCMQQEYKKKKKSKILQPYKLCKDVILGNYITNFELK